MKRLTILLALTTVFLGGCVAGPYDGGYGSYGGGNYGYYGGGNGFEQRDHYRGGEGREGRGDGRGGYNQNGGGWNVSNPGGSDH